jgi:fused signal recognition particle receptor
VDPNDILALVGGGGGVVVIGAGIWAWVRSRGRSGTDEKRKGGSGSGTSTGSDTAHSSTATATKERPAAPTWGDTLSAPAPAREPSPSTAEAGPAQPPETTSPAEAGPGTPQDQAPTEQAAPAQDTQAAQAPGEGEPAGPASPTEGDAAETTEEPAPTASDAAETTEESAPTEDEPAAAAPVLDEPEPAAGRMLRLRERLARSGSIGRGLLGLLSSGTVDESTWDEIEETLLLADLGPDATDELMENLRRRVQVINTDDVAEVREVLRSELVALVDPELDRRIAATRRTAPDGESVPSVILMVGVNGTGKTTTVGKLARVLVAEHRTVVLGAADTFRAAAADQLATWGGRVGVETVRADREGADPAAVAFDAVHTGIENGSDVVIVDTAGRLQNKKGLMDELGKVRRVSEKGLHGDEVGEVLLVLDATTGQNGMQQARVFAEAVQITGIVLTKLDGTAKGGIVVNVQRELGVPVKMVGLGEGMDDLTPFDPYGFVDALIDEA